MNLPQSLTIRSNRVEPCWPPHPSVPSSPVLSPHSPRPGRWSSSSRTVLKLAQVTPSNQLLPPISSGRLVGEAAHLREKVRGALGAENQTRRAGGVVSASSGWLLCGRIRLILIATRLETKIAVTHSKQTEAAHSNRNTSELFEFRQRRFVPGRFFALVRNNSFARRLPYLGPGSPFRFLRHHQFLFLAPRHDGRPFLKVNTIHPSAKKVSPSGHDLKTESAPEARDRKLSLPRSRLTILSSQSQGDPRNMNPAPIFFHESVMASR